MTYGPIHGPPLHESTSQHPSLQRTQSRPRNPLENPCSCSLSDGYSRTGVDDEGATHRLEHDADLDQESQFTVKWDDENDPMNPRSMSLLRRWVIVTVISMGSACV